MWFIIVQTTLGIIMSSSTSLPNVVLQGTENLPEPLPTIKSIPLTSPCGSRSSLVNTAGFRYSSMLSGLLFSLSSWCWHMSLHLQTQYSPSPCWFGPTVEDGEVKKCFVLLITLFQSPNTTITMKWFLILPKCSLHEGRHQILSIFLGSFLAHTKPIIFVQWMV